MRRRQGFTLVELLVVMALIVFIMVILSEAYAASMQSFRLLKAIGDMDARLRTASTVLRADLSADHFEGRKRLSDPDFWAEGPPREGFFRIWHGSPRNLSNPLAPYSFEGNDNDGLPSNRATDHLLHFTVKKRGNNRGDFFSAQVPPGSPLLSTRTNFFDQPPDARYQEAANTYTSQWAEVAYFLRPNGSSTSTNLSLYALYRRQRIVVPNNMVLNSTSPITATYAQYADLSCAQNGTTLYFNNPADLTVPERRLNPQPIELDTGDVTRQGTDLLLTDVLSFEVKALVPGQFNFVALHDLGMPSNPLFASPTGPRVFDTWSSHREDSNNDGIFEIDYSTWNQPNTAKSLPLQVRILALEITLRVWDFKTEQTRQITIIQDM